jgi:hypothetical protein
LAFCTASIDSADIAFAISLWVTVDVAVLSAAFCEDMFPRDGIEE